MPEFDSWQKLVSPLTCVVYFQHASDCVGVQIALVLQTYFLQTWLLVGFTKVCMVHRGSGVHRFTQLGGCSYLFAFV